MYKKLYYKYFNKKILSGGGSIKKSSIKKSIQSGSGSKEDWAPGRKCTKETCLNNNEINVLLKKNNLKVSNNDNVKNKLQALKSKYSNTVCKNDEVCWLDYSAPELSQKVLKPIAPTDSKTTWLNTRDLDRTMIQYESKYSDFKFLGTHAIDFQDYEPRFHENNFDISKYIKNGKKRLGAIFNLDTINQPGSHWVGFFVDIPKKKINYFDSFGRKYRDTPKEIKSFADRIQKQVKKCENIHCDFEVNETQYQNKNTECGVFSMFFMRKLLEGNTLKYLSKYRKKINDDFVNELRRHNNGNETSLMRLPTLAGYSDTLKEYWPQIKLGGGVVDIRNKPKKKVISTLGGGDFYLQQNQQSRRKRK